MKLKTISTITALFLAVPFGSYAIKSQAKTNPILSSKNSTIMNQEQLYSKHHRGGKNHEQRWERMKQELGLTPEQQTQISQIRDDFSVRGRELKEEMKTNRQELHSLLSSDASNNQLRSKHQQLQKLYQQAGNAKFEMMLDIREVLTPEQRTKLMELRSQRPQHSGGYR